MSLYDGIKDVAKIVQQADNIDLYRQLLDLSAQALDLQAENAKLKEEIENLKKTKDLSDRIVRHKDPVVTLANDTEGLQYCSHCWDSAKLLIQLRCGDDGSYYCRHCGARGYFQGKRRQLTIF